MAAPALRFARGTTLVSLLAATTIGGGIALASCTMEESGNPSAIEDLDGSAIGDASADHAAAHDDASSGTDSRPTSDGASGADASGDSDASPDPCSDRIVCENFESTPVGQAPGSPWVVESSKGTVIVDRTHVHGGQNALKVSVEATTSDDTYRQAMLSIKGAPLIPLAHDTVFGRFYLWTDRVPDASVHYSFATGTGPQGNGGLSATYNYGGMGNLMANYYRNTAPDPNDCWQTKNETFPTGAWKCVAFELDGENNEMRFWLDDVEVQELHVFGNTKTDQTCTKSGVDGRWLAPTFSTVRVGWESYQHDAAGKHDAWIDDVIFDDAPIACAP